MVCYLRASNRHCEAGFVETAGGGGTSGVGDRVAIAGAKSSAIARAGVCDGSRGVVVAILIAVAREDGECNEGTTEADVEDDGEEGKEADAAEEAGQQDGQDGVDNRDSRQALNSLPVARDGNVAVGENGQEVRVDSENNASAAEFEEVEEGGQDADGTACEGRHFGRVRDVAGGSLEMPRTCRVKYTAR